MKEDFLHYIWRIQRFDHQNLQSTTGQAIQIITAGTHNHHAGPDFSNARIRIGKTLWAGNVEIHVKASEWLQHRHHHDAAYGNVILHVVLEEDEVIYHASGERIPCLELKPRIEAGLLGKYLQFIHNENWIPCQAQIHQSQEMTWQLWLDRLLVERLEAKTATFERLLQRNANDWEAAFYQLLARNYGLKVNGEPFEQLARSLPLTMLSRHKNKLLEVEALLFGQAGMLAADFVDAYPKKLKKEYGFLQQKYQLRPIPVAAWKFMRLRPANFPTLRIAQLAMLLHQSAHLFSKTLAIKKVKEVEHMFDRRVSRYWEDHYQFDKPSERRPKKLGTTTIHLFIINTIAPALFHYGKKQDDERFKNKALSLLEELKPEQNKVIAQWKSLGIEAGSAYQSQALLQLKKQYCDQKKCLQCAVGHSLLK